MSALADTRAAPVVIDVGGGPLEPDHLSRVIEVRVEQNLSMPDRAVMRIADPNLEIIDGDLFAVGRSLEVRLGSPSSTSKPAEVFSGEVVSIEADMGLSGTQVTLIALDKSHRLRRNTHTKAFNNATAGDVTRKIASDAGLRVGKLETTGPPRELVFQDGESDWKLLERLASEEGCDVTVDGGVLELLERRTSGTPVKLTLGETLRSFRPRLSGVAQVDEIEVRSWNPTAKQPISEMAKLEPAVAAQNEERQAVASGLGGGRLVVVDRPADSSEIARTMATAAAGELGGAVLQGTGVAIGDPRIRAGSAVSLESVGKRFGGEHRVVAATHVLRGGRGYETRFTIGAGGGPLVAELAGSARRSGFAAALAIGLFTNNSDPNQLGRVKVKYPTLDEQVESTWVRVAWPAAGSARGMLVVPQVGDEVAIGFEHGDVERPLVLGVLFNGQDKPDSMMPPVEPQSLGLKVPGSVITTADGNVKTSAKAGIAMSSDGPVNVQSKGELQISSDAPLQISSQATAKMSGLVTTIEAQTAASLKANGALEISSTGAVTIKGAAIQIQSSGPLQLAGMPVVLG